MAADVSESKLSVALQRIVLRQRNNRSARRQSRGGRASAYQAVAVSNSA